MAQNSEELQDENTKRMFGLELWPLLSQVQEQPTASLSSYIKL